ncbi:MAG: pyrimidine 5'-nucleotidase [Maricaulaceae bacterium]|jgi:putative hydrolase of the HAD superfamily
MTEPAAPRAPQNPPAGFEQVEAWAFDLDNTLYPSECDLFAQVDVRMTEYVARALGLSPGEARAVQKRYYAEHGTTLAGLMKLHDVPPDDFLDYVHDIDLAPVEPCAILRANIAALPGRKFVFTNGSRGHADRVLDKRGLTGLFDDVFDITASAYAPKPMRDAYERFVAHCGVDPRRAAMFEDIPRNLAPAAEMGFVTVLVRTGKDWSYEPEHARPAGPGEAPDHVDHVTDDLTAFLGTLRAKGV